MDVKLEFTHQPDRGQILEEQFAVREQEQILSFQSPPLISWDSFTRAANTVVLNSESERELGGSTSQQPGIKLKIRIREMITSL